MLGMIHPADMLALTNFWARTGARFLPLSLAVNSMGRASQSPRCSWIRYQRDIRA